MSGSTNPKDTEFDGNIYNDYWLNEIKDQNLSSRQIVIVSCLLIGAFITFIVNNISTIVTIIFSEEHPLLFLPKNEYSILFVILLWLLPIVFWTISIIKSISVLTPEEKPKLICAGDNSKDFLISIAKHKNKKLNDSSRLMETGLFILVALVVLLIFNKLISSYI